MAATVAIGIQSFKTLREKNLFYIDKSDFIREWWESEDAVTLIARPRRFGKTLNMSMVEAFFSLKYANRGDLFEGLSIWEDEKYRALQGTYPVLFLSFARIKETNYENCKAKICEILRELYIKFSFVRDSEVMTETDREFFDQMLEMDIPDVVATSALYQLSDYLYRYYGKKVIILLDEYDTPMQEAYVNGFSRDSNEPSDCLQAFGDCSRAHGSMNHERKELVAFTRTLFNSSFKTNPALERAIMTGITRVSKESIFSDLNNLEVVTTTSEKYATSFGFTEEEVFEALEKYGYSDSKDDVKFWYDGFTFGEHRDIYNPWSILNFLDKGKIGTYWANTSSNGLVGKLIREGDGNVKETFERLLQGETIRCPIDEQIVYDQLDDDMDAIWSLLLASGYLKVIGYEQLDEIDEDEDQIYELTLTNQEVRRMFRSMVQGWFKRAKADYSGFVRSLLKGNLKEMNAYMNEVALKTFSFFDTGKNPSRSEPERFYHGFVLGLIVDLGKEYEVLSNRESGYGRYDVMIVSKDVKQGESFILEFKVHDPEDEKSLADTVSAAHAQIEEMQYDTALIERGIPLERIHKYGFAFEGKKVLIG